MIPKLSFVQLKGVFPVCLSHVSEGTWSNGGVVLKSNCEAVPKKNGDQSEGREKRMLRGRGRGRIQ